MPAGAGQGLTGVSLLLATGNDHKLGELEELLAGVTVRLVSLRDVGLGGMPEETDCSFAGNALIKARYCVGQTGLLSLADDSGLEVDVLGGAPGVHSNRWAGPGRSDRDRIEMLLARLRGKRENERTARFVCVVAVVAPGGEQKTFTGVLEGRIATEPAGTSGFGYDPVFYLPDRGRTVAELPDGEKNRISHRARAIQAAKPWLLEYLSRPQTSRLS